LGKQRSKVLRRKAEELHKLFPSKFSVDFENNKTVLEGMKLFKSKTDRNIVAGYMVKLAKVKEL
jgi:ribosomal protein S17E